MNTIKTKKKVFKKERKRNARRSSGIQCTFAFTPDGF